MVCEFVSIYMNINHKKLVYILYRKSVTHEVLVMYHLNARNVAIDTTGLFSHGAYILSELEENHVLTVP